MPPDYLSPGVDVWEVAGAVRPIAGVSTSETAFVDDFAMGPPNSPERVSSFTEFEIKFGGLAAFSPASYSIRSFFENGGRNAWVVRIPGSVTDAASLLGEPEAKTGLYALDHAPDCRILCLPAAAELPPAEMHAVYAAVLAYCERRRIFLVIDIPASVADPVAMHTWLRDNVDLRHPNAAVYYPRIYVADPITAAMGRNLANSGAVAGLYARTDSRYTVYKAPANDDLHGVQGFAGTLNEAELELLGAAGVNPLWRLSSGRTLCWGARTLSGDQEWKYVSVRRLVLFIEESLYRGTQWAVFEPNAEPLWKQVRCSVEDFLLNLWKAGAFVGNRPEDAFFVRCDGTTMTQNEIDNGTLVILVGFAPLRPAEFVMVRITQRMATA